MCICVSVDVSVGSCMNIDGCLHVGVYVYVLACVTVHVGVSCILIYVCTRVLHMFECVHVPTRRDG